MDLENIVGKLKGNVREVPEESLEIPDDLSGMEDAEDLLAPDPPPARRTGKAPARKSAPKPTAAVRREVSDALTMMITIPAGIVALRDPYCGGAALDAADAMVSKLVPIVCRNPGMLRWFTEGSGYLDWLGLATAAWPVLTTFWGHHVSHTIGDEHDDDADDFSGYAAPPFSG